MTKVLRLVAVLALPAMAAYWCGCDDSCGCGDDFVVNAAVWGSPQGDLFIAGYRGADHGFVKALANGRWEVVLETALPLWGIWGTSSSHLFVFGGLAAPIVMRRAGEQWESWDLSDLWDGRSDSTIGGIWGTGDEDVFVVGRQGTIAHFDGTSWEPMPAPSSADLEAVWGSSGGDVIAVGAGGTILRYDGTAWAEEASPTSAGLNGVWGSSATDVFVIGESEPEQAHVILHYDGDLWAKVHEGAKTLLGIHGLGPDCIYAVGGRRTGEGIESGLFLFDGDSWTEQPNEAAQFLWDVWPTPPCDFYAVGPDDTIVNGTH